MLQEISTTEPVINSLAGVSRFHQHATTGADPATQESNVVHKTLCTTVPTTLIPLERFTAGMNALAFARSWVQGADLLRAARVNDLLLPIVKGAGSERAYECLTQSPQTLGGSGFLADYPLEQYPRDAKIDSLYEGTTAIQALGLFFRKIVRDDAIALTHLFRQIQQTLDRCEQSPAVEPEPLRGALEHV